MSEKIESPQEQVKYRGYTIRGHEGDYSIFYDGIQVAAGNLLEDCRATIDEDICERKAALAKKMGRSENDPNALI